MEELLRSPRKLLLFTFEGILVALAVVISAIVRLGWARGLAYPLLPAKALVVALVFQSAAYYAGYYDLQAVRSGRRVYGRALRAYGIGSAVLWMLFYAIPPLGIGRGIFLSTIAMSVVAVPTWRSFYNRVSQSQVFTRGVLILGNGELAQEVARIVKRQTNSEGLELVGMLARDPGRVDMREGIVGTYADLAPIVEAADVKLVIVAYPDRRGTLPVQQLLELKFRGVEVVEGLTFFERQAGKIFVRELKPSQLIFSEGFVASPATRRLKRLLDVFCAGLGLLFAWPIMLFAAIAIKLTSRGPVLYRQVRAGELGRLFQIIKFRSMRVDAEAKGAQFAQENDSRITPIGRFLRKSRIDELPQLWNVLKGDMSMVGPRPERPVFIAKLEQQVPFFRQRLYVKPGVTGHAQVRCRYGASADDMLEKLQYDLFYIKHASVLLDLSIMLDTVRVVILREGAR